MKQISVFLLLLLFVFAGEPAKSQLWGPSIINLNYTPRIPTGDLNRFVGEPSLLSFDLSYMNTIKKHWSAGFASGYSKFYTQLERLVYPEGTNDVSAVQTRQLEVVPVLAKARYLIGENHLLKPYFGLGFGAGVVIFHKYWGVFSDNENRTSFRFCVEPEAGTFFQFGAKDRLWLHLGASYMYIPYHSNDLGSIQYLGFKLGVGYRVK